MERASAYLFGLPWPGEGQRTRGRSALLRSALSSLFLLTFLLAVGSAQAQWTRPPFPGTKPTKIAGGTDIKWNGSRYEVPPGGEILWTIRIPNDGEPDGVQVWVLDDIPDPADGAPVAPFNLGTDLLEAPAGGTLEYDGDRFQHSDFLIPFGGESVHVIRTTVDALAEQGTQICNSALISYVQAEPAGGPAGGIPGRWSEATRNEAGIEAPSCVIVGDGAILGESTKSVVDADGDGILEAGELVTYTITLRNTGFAPALDVLLADDLDPRLSFVSASDGGTLTGRRVSWDEISTPGLASLAVDDEISVEFTALVGCVDDGGELCNQAFAVSDSLSAAVPTGYPGGTGVNAPTCAPTARPVLTSSPLTVVDDNGDGAFAAGEVVTYTLTVTNTGGGDGRDVEARLPVPACLLEAMPADGGMLVLDEIVWTSAGMPALGLIPPGGTVDLQFTARIDPVASDGMFCCAQATLRAYEECAAEPSDDPGPAGAMDVTCFNVSNLPELDLALEASTPSGLGSLGVAEVVEYRVTVTWTGGADASNVNVELPLPTGLFEALQADDGSVLGEVLSWSPVEVPALVSMGPGDVVVLTGRATLICTLEDGLAACAAALATGDNLVGTLESDDPSLPAPDDPTCVTLAVPVLSGSTLIASDDGGDGVFGRGEGATLQLTITNTGSAPALGVAVELPLLGSDLDVLVDMGGLVGPDLALWNATVTPELIDIPPSGVVILSVSLRIHPDTLSTRACHQATLTIDGHEACGVELSHDPILGGVEQPTCWDIVDVLQPPGEVPDGDPASGGPNPVRLTRDGLDLLLTWDVAPNAEWYAVYRGPLSAFREAVFTNPAVPINDPENMSLSCDLSELRYLDEEECSPGVENHYFLVTGWNDLGEGPNGEMFPNGPLESRPDVLDSCP